MSFSSWKELIQGVPQGSVLGPLLFNIYLNDLFFILTTYVCNFADDTTPFVCDFELKNVLDKLECNADLAVSWFETNYMKLNPDKCHWFKDLLWISSFPRLLMPLISGKDFP